MYRILTLQKRGVVPMSLRYSPDQVCCTGWHLLQNGSVFELGKQLVGKDVYLLKQSPTKWMKM